MGNTTIGDTMSDDIKIPAEDKQAKFAETIATAVAKATLEVQEKIRPIEITPKVRKSAFNPTGEKKEQLKRRIIFCSHEEDENSLTPEEIALYNQLQPGRYNNRKWEVVLHEGNGEKDTLQIRIPVSSQDDRMDLYINGGSLKQICERMIAEAKQRSSAA